MRYLMMLLRLSILT